LLLQRGAFDVSDTQLTAFALAFFSIGLVGHALVEIASRGFYALKNTLTPVVIGIAVMGVNILLSLLLIQPLAHGGLALANSVATLMEAAVLLWLLRSKLGGWEERRVAQTAARSLAATGVMALTVWLLLRIWQEWPQPLLTVVVGVVAVVVYGVIAWMLRAPELQTLRELAGR
jgi:putative peptidoglycan lipid II flippase